MKTKTGRDIVIVEPKKTRYDIVIIASAFCLLLGILTPGPIGHNVGSVIHANALWFHVAFATIGIMRVVVFLVRREERFCWIGYTVFLSSPRYGSMV